MCVRPVASAPNISARWEIDLSPGTRTRADSARDLPADSGEGGRLDKGGNASIWASTWPQSGHARPPAGRRCCAAIEQRAKSVNWAVDTG